MTNDHLRTADEVLIRERAAHRLPEQHPLLPPPGIRWAVLLALVFIVPMALYLGVSIGSKGGVVDHLFPNATVRCEP